MGDAFDLNKASDLLDDRMAKNIMGDLRKQLGPEGFPKPTPVIKDYSNEILGAYQGSKLLT